MLPLKYHPLTLQACNCCNTTLSPGEVLLALPKLKEILILFLMKSICFPITKIGAEDTVSWFGGGDAWQVETSEG